MAKSFPKNKKLYLADLASVRCYEAREIVGRVKKGHTTAWGAPE